MNALDRNLIANCRQLGIGINNLDRKIKKPFLAHPLTSSLAPHATSPKLPVISTFRSTPILKSNPKIKDPDQITDLFQNKFSSDSRTATNSSYHEIINEDDLQMDLKPIDAAKRNTRKRLNYGTNYSIARESESHGPDQCLNNQNSINESHACRIKDHAQRRLQLFYYLSVAYHNEGCHIQRDKTLLQHGISKCMQCSAAHSSILPNVSDDFFQKLAENILIRGIDLNTKGKLLSLGAKEDLITNKKFDLKKWPQLFRNMGIKGELKLISSSCHFYQNLNSTVELPLLVNQFDSLIENELRPIALNLLNQVSLDGVKPYDALTKLADLLQQFFKKSEFETANNINLLKKIHFYETTLFNLEQALRKNGVKDQKKWLINYSKTVSLLEAAAAELSETPSPHTFPVKKEICSPEHLKIFKWMKKVRCDDPCNIEKNYQNLFEKLSIMPVWTPSSIDKIILMLENTLQIVQWQATGSTALPYKFLSGIAKNGNLHAMSAKQLFSQKLEIIRRK